MTKQEIQAYRDAEAEIALNQYTDGSSIYEEEHFRQGYIAGFDTGAELERKRAQVLVDLLKLIASSNRFVFLLGIEDTAKQAIEAYEKETAE